MFFISAKSRLQRQLEKHYDDLEIFRKSGIDEEDLKILDDVQLQIVLFRSLLIRENTPDEEKRIMENVSCFVETLHEKSPAQRRAS